MAVRKTRSRVRRPASRRISRSPRRTSHAGSPWTREEIQFMRKYYRNNETAWVARQLGRTVYSVRYKASDLSIRKASPSIWRGNFGTSTRKAKSRTKPTRKWGYQAKTRRSTSRKPRTRHAMPRRRMKSRR